MLQLPLGPQFAESFVVDKLNGRILMASAPTCRTPDGNPHAQGCPHSSIGDKTCKLFISFWDGELPNAGQVAAKKFTCLGKSTRKPKKTQGKQFNEPKHVNFSDAAQRIFWSMGEQETKSSHVLKTRARSLDGHGRVLGTCWMAILGRGASPKASGMSGVPEHLDC